MQTYDVIYKRIILSKIKAMLQLLGRVKDKFNSSYGLTVAVILTKIGTLLNRTEATLLISIFVRKITTY